MQETRRARLQSVIQQELSQFIARELKDPRIPPLTVTAVEVTPDGGQATVYVAPLGATVTPAPEAEVDEKAARKRITDCLGGLASASGFMRRHLANVLTVRHVPSLVFKEDKGILNASRVHELLKQIIPDPSKPS